MQGLRTRRNVSCKTWNLLVANWGGKAIYLREMQHIKGPIWMVVQRVCLETYWTIVGCFKLMALLDSWGPGSLWQFLALNLVPRTITGMMATVVHLQFCSALRHRKLQQHTQGHPFSGIAPWCVEGKLSFRSGGLCQFRGRQQKVLPIIAASCYSM
jgi:hypothetical protein